MNISVFNGAQNEDYNVIRSFSYYKPSVISNLVLGTKSSYSGPGGELENEKRKVWKESPRPFLIIRGFCYLFFFHYIFIESAHAHDIYTTTICYRTITTTQRK